jgi:hypothetical protein
MQCSFIHTFTIIGQLKSLDGRNAGTEEAANNFPAESSVLASEHHMQIPSLRKSNLPAVRNIAGTA